MKFLFKCSIILSIASIGTTPFANGQTAENIIAGYVNFIGGAKAWTAVKTIIMRGEYNYGGMPFPFNTYSKAPDLYKLTVPYNGKYYAQGFDGSRGWKIDAFKNETTPTWMSGPAARAIANEADVELESALINYLDKGHTVVLENSDTINGKLCDVVRLTRKTKEVERYYFDRQTYELLMKSAASKNTELSGAPLNIFYEDYRTSGAIKIAYKTTCESEGQTILTITITDVSINKPIDNKEFQPE